MNLAKQLQPKRAKVFGLGRPCPLDRNAKARLMTKARGMMRRTVKGKAYGAVTAKAYAVLGALLYGFHNTAKGLCFPSYQAIADAAHCARSTVGAAIVALEAAGLLSWTQRIYRSRERIAGLSGASAWRWRVVRTSNAYLFSDPISTKSEKSSGTKNQVLHFGPVAAAAACSAEESRLDRSLSRLEGAFRRR